MSQTIYNGEERRSAERIVRTFMPACIEVDGKNSVALLRNISSSGAGFEGHHHHQVGQELLYRWGDRSLCKGKVIWVDGSRFGVANEEIVADLGLDAANYRSVRVGLSAPASVFFDGKRHEGELLNFGQKGLCALLSGQIRDGALATVKVGRRYFENVTAKWTSGDRVGFALPKGMAIPEMSELASGR